MANKPANLFGHRPPIELRDTEEPGAVKVIDAFTGRFKRFESATYFNIKIHKAKRAYWC